MIEQQLIDHLRNTPGFIEQHRARVTPGGRIMNDLPGSPNGYGPKSPCNDGAILLADSEGATIGRLASYCQNRGTIPYFPLKGFWWVKGRCLGLSSGDGLAEFRAVVRTLESYAAEILATEGIAPYLKAMEEIRGVSEAMFPHESDEWLTMSQAKEFTGRSQSTIYEWIAAGGIPTLDDRWGLMISRNALHLKLAIVAANKKRNIENARQCKTKVSV